MQNDDRLETALRVASRLCDISVSLTLKVHELDEHLALAEQRLSTQGYQRPIRKQGPLPGQVNELRALARQLADLVSSEGRAS